MVLAEDVDRWLGKTVPRLELFRLPSQADKRAGGHLFGSA